MNKALDLLTDIRRSLSDFNSHFLYTIRPAFNDSQDVKEANYAIGDAIKAIDVLLNSSTRGESKDVTMDVYASVFANDQHQWSRVKNLRHRWSTLITPDDKEIGGLSDGDFGRDTIMVVVDFKKSIIEFTHNFIDPDSEVLVVYSKTNKYQIDDSVFGNGFDALDNIRSGEGWIVGKCIEDHIAKELSSTTLSNIISSALREM